jgi:hypothetical protein
MFVSSALCTIYENHCLETHLRVWYWLFLLLWWWLINLLWWCGSFLKNMKKSIALHQKLQLSLHDTEGTSRTTVSFNVTIFNKLASSSLQSHGLNSCSSCSRSWIQSQSRDRLSTLTFFVIFLSPSMQISENCLKLNYREQTQTNLSPMSLSGWFHHQNGAISLHKWLQDYTLVILTFSILGAVNVYKSTHFHFIPDYRGVGRQLLSDNHCTSLYLYNAHL